MKKIFPFIISLFLSVFCLAQEQLYFTFEFMRVDETQTQEYLEIETFWEGIHKQRVLVGEILGWDLWSLQPGGEDQGYQYLTVTEFKNMSDMMKGTPNDIIFKHAKNAHPGMPEKNVQAILDVKTPQSRDLAVRMYLSRIDATNEGLEIEVGGVARYNFMMAISENYETMESMVFKPWHQRMVDHDLMANWSLLRVLFPSGSYRYASHMTVDKFIDMDHFVNSIDFDFGDNSVQDDLATEEGIKTRDLKEVVLATLIKKVR